MKSLSLLFCMLFLIHEKTTPQIFNSSGYIDQNFNQELCQDNNDIYPVPYFGKKTWVEEIYFKENKKIVSIYSINGQFLGNDPSILKPGIYIYLMEIDNIRFSKKVLKTGIE